MHATSLDWEAGIFRGDEIASMCVYWLKKLEVVYFILGYYGIILM